MALSQVMKRVGCAAFTVALLCGVVACAAGAGRTDAQRQTDGETAARVQAALDADKHLYAKHITVRVDHGVARLSGYVWDPPDIGEAKSVAELVDGVSGVVNDLELQRNGIDNSGVSR